MINSLKIISYFLLLFIFSNCSQVLQTVELKVNTEDNSNQEDFNVIEKSLTLAEARKQNESSYNRTVLQTGIGQSARSISESIAAISVFPEKKDRPTYKIGVGDTISLSRLLENNLSKSDFESTWPNEVQNLNYRLGIGDTVTLTFLREGETGTRIAPVEGSNQNLITNQPVDSKKITSRGLIGSDGSVLLLEAGRLEANGKTLNDLRSEVRNILIRNGVSPRFQLEITAFNSQKAYLTVNEASEVIVLNNQDTTLKDVLTSASIGFVSGVITRVKLQRDGKEYLMKLRKIFSENAPKIIIKSNDHIFVEDTSTQINTSQATVGFDGNIIFAGVGKIKADGLSLSEFRQKIASEIDKLPDSTNEFQFEVTNFGSQSAILNIPGERGGSISISDRPVSLDKVLIDNGLSVEGDKITRVILNRKGQKYKFTLSDLLKADANRVYLQSNDRVTIEKLPYKENKVFILGGVSPQIFKINPAIRETLADVLFTKGGPLGSSNAKRSEIYLLRGSKPVIAYHLNAQSPTRLIVADAMELRPNDILYVAQQPIISFNRTLATIVPLRVLLRDIQDENIP